MTSVWPSEVTPSRSSAIATYLPPRCSQESCLRSPSGPLPYRPASSRRMSRRADQAIRVLREYSAGLRPGNAATLPDATTLEIFLDDPGHQRLPNPVEELMARCLLLLWSINRHLRVYTVDYGNHLLA